MAKRKVASPIGVPGISITNDQWHDLWEECNRARKGDPETIDVERKALEAIVVDKAASADGLFPPKAEKVRGKYVPVYRTKLFIFLRAAGSHYGMLEKEFSDQKGLDGQKDGR